MMLYYACRQEPSISALWESPPRNRWKQMQRLTDNHWTELRNSYWRVRERIEDPEGERNSTRRPTESTTLDPWQLSETEPPTKEHKRAELRPHLIGLPCLPTMEEAISNPAETWYTRAWVYEGAEGGALYQRKRDGRKEGLCERSVG